MKLSASIKRAIEREYNEWKDSQYSGKDKKARQEKGQFFTPPVLTIKMLEKFDSVEDKDILDPAGGAGGLIAAAIIAGADPKRCYCIELDPVIATICRKRLAKLGVPKWHVKVGNALDPSSYDFSEEDKDSYKDVEEIVPAAPYVPPAASNDSTSPSRVKEKVKKAPKIKEIPEKPRKENFVELDLGKNNIFILRSNKVEKTLANKSKKDIMKLASALEKIADARVKIKAKPEVVAYFQMQLSLNECSSCSVNFELI